jgi:hypothetical protein
LTALHRFSGAIRLDPALYSEQDRVWVAANSQPILRRGVPLYHQLGMAAALDRVRGLVYLAKQFIGAWLGVGMAGLLGFQRFMNPRLERPLN